MITRPALWSVLALTALACRPAQDPESSAQSLDNLASADGHAVQNSCAGSFGLQTLDAATAARVKAQTQYPKALEADVLAALSAVPNGLKKVFFGFGYELKFAADAAQTCAARGNRQAGEPTLSCAIPQQVKDKSGNDAEKLTLLVSAKPEDVRHGTLLALLSVVTKQLPRVRFENGAPVLADADDEGSASFRRSLAVHVLHDEFAAGRAGFARLSALLPADPAFKAKATALEDRGAIFERFEQASPAEAAAVEQLVFENAADSYYCSVKSKAAMQKLYPNALALFDAEMAPVIAGLGGGAAQRSYAGGSAGGGFGLWGRWGWGNGPLRQFFANRIDDTGYAFPRLAGYRRAWNGDGWVMPTGGLGWRVNGEYAYPEEVGWGLR